MSSEATVYEATLNPYPTWLKYADERDHLEAWLRKNISLICPKPFTTILDIGSGLGEATARLVTVLDEQQKGYSITAIEPVAAQAEHCRKRFSKNQRVRIEQSTSEKYQGPIVDLSLAVHSLYYVSVLTDALTKIRSLGKRSLIVHHGLRGINTIHQAFPHFVKTGPHIISTHQDIERELDELGVKYQTDCLESRVDIRPTHDFLDPDGRDLIRFFLEQPELEEEVYKELSAFLRERGDYLIHDVGIIILPFSLT